MNRWSAAPMHLALSALVASLVFAVIYFVWYTGALFGTAGGRTLFFLIAGVDVIVGPLITLIVFRPGKKGLKLDLVIIAILQAVALSYGVWVLFESRPAWIVYVKDRYELVRATQILDAEREKAKPPYDGLPITGPKLVGARMPTDPSEQLRIALTAARGQDVQTYPQYLVPYDTVRKQVEAHAQPLSRLRELNPARRSLIDALPAELHRSETDLGFLPMRAGKSDLTVIVDRRNGDFLEIEPLRPWEY